MSDSYPSWKLVLHVRFEDYSDGVLKDRVPPKATKSLDGIKDDGAQLEAVPDPDKPGRFIIQRKNSGPTGIGKGPWFDPSSAPANPVLPQESPDGLTAAPFVLIPQKFDLRRNGIRTPDELAVTLRYWDFPFDPRLVRACAVEFYLGSFTDQEYARGVADVSAVKVIPDTYLDSNGNQRTNLRFQGWVESFKMTWNDDEPLVELECRDNTQILQNQLAPPKLTIAANKPLDEAIATYLSNFPQCAGFTVEYLASPEKESPPVLEKVLAGTAFRPGLGPTPAKGAGDDDDLQVWDYITDVCGALGLVCYVDATAVVISRPFTVLGGAASTRATDPYVSRKLPDGEFPIRTLMFGQNLSSFEVARDFAAKEPRNIELRSWNPRRKKLLVARYPTKADRIVSTLGADHTSDNKWNVVRVRGVEDDAMLRQMAKDYYVGRMRSEIEIVAKTNDLCSYGGDERDPDLLDMMPTDPIEITTDRNASSTMGEIERRANSSEEFMTVLGYSPATAKAYAKAAEASGFQRIFRVSSLSISGDAEEGVEIEIQAKNFIQVRAEK